MDKLKRSLSLFDAVNIGFGYYLAFFVPRISIHVGDALAIDLSGLKMFRGRMRTITLLGFLSLLVLMFHLPSLSWLAGFVVVMTGILFYRIFCYR